MTGNAQEGRSVSLRAGGRPAHALSVRFWIVCALLVPLNLVWSVWTLSGYGPWFDENPLLANVVVYLFVLAGVNAALRRIRPAWVFSQAELLLLYTMLAVSTAVGGSCYGQGLAMVLAYPFWFGNPDALGVSVFDWRPFLSDLPLWSVVSDPEVLAGFWQGQTSFLSMQAVEAWARPVLAWSGLIMSLFGGTMCLNVLLRRRWVEDERLTFPIVWLPLEMTHPSGALFRSRLLWLGFVAAGAIPILNGLAYFYPTLPRVPVEFRLWHFFADRPWDAMERPTITFHPMMIGLGYLLPQDLLFASWFFHFYWQLQRVASSALGFSLSGGAMADFPYIGEQAYGGLLALGGIALWGARSHLAAAWRRAWHRSGSEFQTEALSERAAFLGLALCAVAVLWFLRLTGMSLVISGLWLGLLAAGLVAMTRIRAESGGPLMPSGPMADLTRLVGTRAFSRQDLVGMALQTWHVRYGFNQPAPYGMEALRMAEASRRSQRRFLVAALVGALIGMVGTIFVELIFAYRLGEAAEFNKTGWGQRQTWLGLDLWLGESTPLRPERIAGVAVGAASVLFLGAMRTGVVGWPLHPVPFVPTAGIGVYVGYFWGPFLIAWLVKLLILRYKGLSGFRTALPLFYGLMLGEMTGGMFWPLYGMLTGTQCYSFFGY